METTKTTKKTWAILTAEHKFDTLSGKTTLPAGTRFNLRDRGLRLTEGGISLLHYHGFGGNELIPRSLLRFEEETITTVTTSTSTAINL